MSKVLIYTFPAFHNSTYKLAKQLESEGYEVLFWYREGSIKRFMESIVEGGFTHVLGLGDYKKNATRIRIEEKFVNKYGRNTIVAQAPEYLNATWQINFTPESYVATLPTNGPCNRSAYMLAYELQQVQLNIKIAFVHVPSRMDKEIVKQHIVQWVEEA